MNPLDEIAELSINITQKQSFQKKENFDKLFSYCKNKDKNVAKCGILSVMQVLIDIIPNYSVNKHNDKGNLSKEVRERRFYEEAILNFARKYIQFCETSVNTKKCSSRIRLAAAKGLCSILAAKPAFNTTDHLIKVVTKLTNNKDEAIRHFACRKIVEVFGNDKNGDLTLKILSEVALMQTNKISTDLLQALLGVKLMKETEELQKKEKEKSKDVDRDLEKELREADIYDNKTEQQKNQIGILEHLFGTVFRFLKETKSEQHFRDSMNVVRHYVDYINIDIVPSIINALKQKRFSLLASIEAAHTALSICKTAEYTVDLRDFFASVYERAYEALDDRNSLLQLLALFEIISGSINKSRTAAFAKRLMIMSLHATPEVASVVICYIRQMFTNEPSMTSSVDFEFEAENEFIISADDPDFCNGTCAKYWELAELCQSSFPFLKSVSQELSTLIDLNAIRDSDIKAAREKRDWSPKAILDKYDNTYRIYDALSIQPKQHILPKQFKVYNFE